MDTWQQWMEGIGMKNGQGMDEMDGNGMEWMEWKLNSWKPLLNLLW